MALSMERKICGNYYDKAQGSGGVGSMNKA